MKAAPLRWREKLTQGRVGRDGVAVIDSGAPPSKRPRVRLPLTLASCADPLDAITHISTTPNTIIPASAC
jgi:hypothetical protein